MSSWSPTLVTNSPLAFKFISLLSTARKNSLPLAFFISLLSKARKNKKLLPPPLDKNGVFGIFDIYIRGETFLPKLGELISGEPYKIQTFPTTRFEDHDLNCVVGWFKKIWHRIMTS